MKWPHENIQGNNVNTEMRFFGSSLNDDTEAPTLLFVVPRELELVIISV